jgi:tetratricopeptide (TPR) repeat protein
MQLATKKEQYVIGSFFILFISIFLSYVDILNHAFLHWDDRTYVLYNEYLHPLTLENLFNIFSDFKAENWHPITWLSYAINFSLFGDVAPLFKATNLVIHFLNSVLVFYISCLFQYISKNPAKHTPLPSIFIIENSILLSSTIAAFLFAIHPQHVESVSWISGRKDLLCTFFYLAAISAYIHLHYSHHKRKWRNVVSLFYTFALMSKSMAVTFPLVIMLLDIYPLNRVHYLGSITRFTLCLFKNKILYLLLGGLVAAITFITQTPNITGVSDYGIFFRLSNSAANFFYYIATIPFPTLVAPYHPLPDTEVLSIPLLLLVNLLFLILFASCYFLYLKNYKLPLILFGSYIIMLLPAIGLIHVGHALRADRYAYLPTFGFYILIAIGIVKTQEHLSSRKYLKYSFYFFLSIYSVWLISTTYNYNKTWATDQLIWEKVIERFPDTAATAYVNLGNVYFEKHKYHLALDLYRKAVTIAPGYLEALQNIGYTYETLNNLDKAETSYLKMLRAAPDSDYPYTVVADYYYRYTNIPKADFYYSKALGINPSSRISLQRSSAIDLLTNDLNSAKKKLAILLELDPRNIEALRLKANISILEKDYKKAYHIASELRKIAPQDKVALEIITKLNKIEKYIERN